MDITVYNLIGVLDHGTVSAKTRPAICLHILRKVVGGGTQEEVRGSPRPQWQSWDWNSAGQQTEKWFSGCIP